MTSTAPAVADPVTPVPITRVGVVGGGLMGAGIAEVCARGRVDVVVTEVTSDAAAAAEQRIAASLDRVVRRGTLDRAAADEARARIRVAVGFDALGDRDLVVEAATENEDLKRAVFADLGRATHPSAILASNTSSIPIARLAAATDRPANVVGIHFFHPATVQQLVEVVPALRTDAVVVARTTAFVTGTLGKTAVTAKDRAGFVVNALLVPYLLGAVRMLEDGHATAEDIDRGMELGCSHPMGPLRLIDFSGVDTTLAAAESMYREYGQPQYKPPALLHRMVESGFLGRKSGRGFYDYPAAGPAGPG